MKVIQYCKNLFVCCIAINWCIANATNNRIMAIEGFQTPQAVVATDSNIYVSNYGIYKEGKKETEGFITKLDKTGKITELYFINNLNMPRGMVVINNILYIADTNTLKAFNLNTKKQILSLQINGATALSSIVMRDSNTLLISDTQAGLIFSVNIKKKSYHTFVAIESSLGGPNCLVLNKDSVYVTTTDINKKARGNVLRINLETKEMQILNDFNNHLEGIAVLDNGNIIISGWDKKHETRFYKISQNNKVYEVDLDEQIHNPSLFLIDSSILWIPDILLHKVFKITT
ncbi:hypothetical protein CQA53_09725 [Helicobacter didelphidarum]|uniref:ATP-binding protein n=1 Tax=Helicobacter didelphidarum TaxID=2040648 RepID=A0A3D8IA07_9HELI|nr:hypothetical protein [Helicobacter didelphidarum]RDU61875.1 hypothetical protein CQA53_09725 [Helicobacter didelphidarum]